MSLLGGIFSGLRSIRGRNRKADRPQWYVSQGEDPTGCGPACAAMAVKWRGGIGTLGDARLIKPVGIWYFANIKYYLSRKNIEVSDDDQYQILNNLSEHSAAIVLIRAGGFINHFVFVTRSGDDLLVCDPMSGARLQKPQRLLQEIASSYVLVVQK